MKSLLLILLFILAGCKQDDKAHDSFKGELEELQNLFHVPGMSVIVARYDTIIFEEYMGYADVVNETPMDSLTMIPMASLTKMLTGYMIAQLSQRNVLEDPINRYVTDQNIPDSIKVKHVLSHTSEGEVGKHFHYSNRFRWLTEVINKGFQSTYEITANANVIVPYSLDHTILLQNEGQISDKKIAKPYVFDGATKPGFIDYGYSASSGMTSTVRDLVKFSNMIRYTTLETDWQPGQQYNFGLFRQEIKGTRVVWAYGQYDCYSSLFLKVPEYDLTFVIAGNNSLLSDPARLIYGDVTTSLFAVSFLKHYLGKDMLVEEAKARALAESYLGQYDPEHAEKSKQLLRTLLKSTNDYYSLATMHNIATLKDIDARNEKPVFAEFDAQQRSIGKKLLSVDKNDPYANIYMASLYDSRKQPDSARLFYTRVAEARNAERNWYTDEADTWLKTHAATSTQGTATPPRE